MMTFKTVGLAGLAWLGLAGHALAGSCESLKDVAVPASAIGLPTSGARILEAGSASTPSVDGRPGAAYCKVLGVIGPVDPSAPDIRFQINLPEAWNGKAMQMGGGGSNGVIPRAVASGVGSPLGGTISPGTPTPLVRGYVTLGSDSGHLVSDDAWYANAEAVTNFAYAQMKKTHDVALALIQARYGRAPGRFYYVGFSQGGREALEVAQRFPADYDGIISQAPVLYFGVPLRAALRAQLQLAPGAWLPPSKAPLIAREVLRQCDALDGLSDGVINAYRRCDARFDPARTAKPYAAIRCPQGGDDGDGCLSDLQIRTANALRRATDLGFATSRGLRTIPGFGTGLEARNWDLLVKEAPSPDKPDLGGRAGALLRITIAHDKDLDLHRFAPADHREAIQALAAQMDTANPDLSAFEKRGGKLIFKSHASDYLASPHALADYYGRVAARMGQARVDRFIRYYVTPNVGHGGEGVAADGRALPQYVDLYTMLEDWVERGRTPPDAPVQTSAPDAAGRSATKPMCRYPAYPRYRGGSPDQAASYVCHVDR